MDTSDAWKSDPLVVVQNATMPVMWLGSRVLLSHQIGQPQTDDWQARFDAAEEMLRSKGAELMLGYGVAISDADLAIFRQAADQIASFRTVLTGLIAKPPETEVTFRTIDVLQSDVRPAVRDAIDHFRMLFINLVIARQKAYAAQTSSAVSGLDRISKQIFFISINASVEAARVGDAGRGFLQISTDMRALSKSAQDATRDLANMVTANSCAN